MDYPGLICDGLRPMFGAAAPALTAALYQLATGVPYEPGEGQ